MSLSLPALSSAPERLTGATVVLVLHVAAGLGLAALAHKQISQIAPHPIRIEMVSAAQEEAPTPPAVPDAPLKPAPAAVAPRPVQRTSTPALIQTETPAPANTTAFTAPAPSPEPPAAVQPETAAPAAPAKAAASGAESIQAPRFDADYLHNPAPAYPRASRDLGEEGRVLLRVQVNEEGRALQVLVDASSGYARLDRAAREAVAQWRFVPARQGQQAVSGWVKVPIVFELKS